GDWGLGPIPNPQSPIPNPQSPKKKYYYINILLYSLLYLYNVKMIYYNKIFVKLNTLIIS
ncbi:MAG: hypothetical protein MJ252_09210, partial [archaeon]|nr:hypothetical protein [archaeon]